MGDPREGISRDQTGSQREGVSSLGEITGSDEATDWTTSGIYHDSPAVARFLPHNNNHDGRSAP